MTRQLSIILFGLFLQFNLRSQIPIQPTELKGMTDEQFLAHQYAKLFKSQPKIKTLIGSGHTIDGGYISSHTRSITYKKEKTVLYFEDRIKDTATQFTFHYLWIRSAKSPFSGKNGIKVGDKIKLSSLSEDLNSHLAWRKEKNYETIESIKSENYVYWFEEIKVSNINKETIVKVKSIEINPFN